MARTDTSEGQALRQPGGAEKDSCFCEDDRHLHLASDDEEEEERKKKTNKRKQTRTNIRMGQDLHV